MFHSSPCSVYVTTYTGQQLMRFNRSLCGDTRITLISSRTDQEIKGWVGVGQNIDGTTWPIDTEVSVGGPALKKCFRKMETVPHDSLWGRKTSNTQDKERRRACASRKSGQGSMMQVYCEDRPSGDASSFNIQH
jgi:hypothetical protein